MSVTHPLLKELKGFILQLRAAGERQQQQGVAQVDDGHPSLLPLCVNLEAILRLGLRNIPSLVGNMKQDYWTWIDFISKCRMKRLPYTAIRQAELVRQNPKLSCSQGRGRAFLRASLVHGILHEVTETLIRGKPELATAYYSESTSCLADEILVEILLSLLYELKEVKFNLNLQNCSFLDETWLLPNYHIYEFVPCLQLGIRIGCSQNRVLVLSVEEHSVAGEDDKIEVGDMLDEVDGQCLTNSGQRQLSQLFKKCRDTPLKIGVVKCHASNGAVYLPLVPLVKHFELEGQVGSNRKSLQEVVLSSIRSKSESELVPFPFQAQQSQRVLSPNDYTKRRVKLHGRSFVGPTGSMTVIEEGIQIVLDRADKPQEVWVEIGETSVLIVCCLTKKTIYRHNFTQIGSCGRRTDFPLVFCYIAGETLCNMAKEFYCYVFEGNSESEAKLILQNIALGFQRTHWAV